MAKIVLDLHDIFNKGREIDASLRSAFENATSKRIPLLEIIPGKGSGQLRKHVIRFLQKKDVKQLYHRIEIKEKNHGKILVHFRF